MRHSTAAYARKDSSLGLRRNKGSRQGKEADFYSSSRGKTTKSTYSVGPCIQLAANKGREKTGSTRKNGTNLAKVRSLWRKRSTRNEPLRRNETENTSGHGNGRRCSAFVSGRTYHRAGSCLQAAGMVFNKRVEKGRQIDLAHYSLYG